MIRIGKIVATHGLQGGLVFTHIVGDSKWLKNESALYLELNRNSYIPFFVSQLKVVNDEEYVINLEETNTVEAAKRLVGKQVYVNEDILSKYVNRSPLLWIGFTVHDKEKGELGKIDDVLETGTQWLAKLFYKDAEVLIPLIEQTIENIDLKNKVLFVDLPEGLLEVYTG